MNFNLNFILTQFYNCSSMRTYLSKNFCSLWRVWNVSQAFWDVPKANVYHLGFEKQIKFIRWALDFLRHIFTQLHQCVHTFFKSFSSLNIAIKRIRRVSLNGKTEKNKRFGDFTSVKKSNQKNTHLGTPLQPKFEYIIVTATLYDFVACIVLYIV